ncbi:MAG: aldo/keto reductase [Spirochaetes bacterium]|jgi:predicted aldo/keto reductase-like oxidoreductase|nr:aldo/keto reductase [Spirochaetota bacterium]
MIEKMKFGKTGHESTRLIFGAAALWSSSVDDGKPVLKMLLDAGINHIDTSVSYGNSEMVIGDWMGKHRNDFFLATKIDARTSIDAKNEMELSLKRLQCKTIDLLQMHEIVVEDEVDTFFNDSGAYPILQEAKKSGKARFTGITSHGFNAPELLLRCIKEGDFDAVLLPYNYLFSRNQDYYSKFTVLRNECRTRNIALQTMKSIARGPWNSATRNRTTWYQPLEDPHDIKHSVHWLLSHPELFACSAGDLDLLPDIIKAASLPVRRPDDDVMQTMVSRLRMSLPLQHQWPRLSQE